MRVGGGGCLYVCMRACARIVTQRPVPVSSSAGLRAGGSEGERARPDVRPVRAPSPRSLPSRPPPPPLSSPLPLFPGPLRRGRRPLRRLGRRLPACRPLRLAGHGGRRPAARGGRGRGRGQRSGARSSALLHLSSSPTAPTATAARRRLGGRAVRPRLPPGRPWPPGNPGRLPGGAAGGGRRGRGLGRGGGGAELQPHRRLLARPGPGARAHPARVARPGRLPADPAGRPGRDGRPATPRGRPAAHPGLAGRRPAAAHVRARAHRARRPGRGRPGGAVRPGRRPAGHPRPARRLRDGALRQGGRPGRRGHRPRPRPPGRGRARRDSPPQILPPRLHRPGRAAPPGGGGRPLEGCGGRGSAHRHLGVRGGRASGVLAGAAGGAGDGAAGRRGHAPLLAGRVLLRRTRRHRPLPVLCLRGRGLPGLVGPGAGCDPPARLAGERLGK